jgi:hypothetical protein
VGKPGTSDAQRVAINAGLWRYHPTRQVFEVVSHGTSNPWGLDFDQHGEAIIEACVIPHAFHMIPGARYLRQAGSHFNPNTYADIGTIADHLHYVGANPHGGNNRSDSAGGGHAHCGTMIYQGGTWPAEYHNQFFLGNINAQCLFDDFFHSFNFNIDSKVKTLLRFFSWLDILDIDKLPIPYILFKLQKVKTSGAISAGEHTKKLFSRHVLPPVFTSNLLVKYLIYIRMQT